MLLATLNSVAAMVRNWPWHSTRPSRWALASKWSAASTKRDAGFAGQQFAHAAAELGMGVDAGADGRAADGQLEQGLDRPRRPGSTDAANCRASPPISWPERQRRGVGQVRPADLQNVLPGGGLLGQHFAASLQCREQSLADRHGGGHVDGRGKDVVGALAQVDVIVGVDRLLGAEAVAAGQLDGPVGDHLVGVHVAGGARAGLEDIDGELVVELSVGHFAAGGQQGVDLPVVERRSCRSRSVCPGRDWHGGRPFHQPQGVNQLGRQRLAGDGEVLHRPLRLRRSRPRPAGGHRPSNRARCRKSAIDRVNCPPRAAGW